MSLECTNKEQPTCPECHEPVADVESVMDHWTFNEALVTCKNCGERIKITVKRLHDTEVVR